MKLMKIWKKKWKILEGLFYNHIVFYFNKKHWAKKEVEERRKICMSCPFLDRYGEAEVTVIKGKPACGICGCNIMELTASLSSECSATERGMFSKWKSINIKNSQKIEESIKW